MAKRKSTSASPAVATQLVRFALVSISGQNDLIGTGTGRVDIRREEEVELQTISPDSETEFCRAVVKIRLAFAGRRERDETDAVRVEATYEGRFAVHPSITIEELDKAAADERFQYGLVSQVYPLASTHVREQLQLMGLSPRNLPLGI